MLLDFDGTLSPIVAHPDDAEIEPESEAALQSLAKNKRVYLGIISGRPLEDVRKKVKITKITFAGNHGLEIDFPNKPPFAYQMDRETQKNYTELVKYLEKHVSVYICLFAEHLILISEL